MTGWFGRTRLRQIAGVVLLTASAMGCTSSSEFEAIKTQIADVQLQILQLQKQGPSKAEIAELEASLQAQIHDILESQADVRLGLEGLAAQISQLESKLDDTNFRLQQLSQQIVATNQELQTLRNAAEKAQARGPSSSPPARQASSGDPRALYDTAYNDYLQGNFDLAVLGFRQYVDSYRTTDLADNATYWIGECYYRQGKFQQAIDEFDAVLSQFTGSDRAASALLKKGYAYLELGQRAQGVVQLQNVVCGYGSTDEAHLAGQRLKELGIDVSC